MPRRTHSKVRRVRQNKRPVAQPVNSETGVLDTEDDFFWFFCACLTLDILSDPHVGNKSDHRSTSQLSFGSVDELHGSLREIMSHWLDALIKRQPLLIPIPICIYNLLQPLLHPTVRTVYGMHKIAVELSKEPDEVNKEVIRLGNEVFDKDGYYFRKYRWDSFVGLQYMTKEGRHGDYKDITYITQRNHKTAQTAGGDNNKKVEIMRRRANPRAAGMLKIGGDQVVGQMRSNVPKTEDFCLLLHTCILPQLKLTSKGVNVGALDSRHVPRVYELDTLQRARVAFFMIVAGHANSLLGVNGVTLHTAGPLITDTATLTTCKALSMLPSANIPGDLMLPPDRDAYQLLQLACCMVRDPTSCLTKEWADVNYVFQSVYSVCKAQLGTTPVPQVMSEALVHSRTVIMPLAEQASVETGYTLSLFVMNKATGIHAPYELWKSVLAKDDPKAVEDLNQDIFSTASYVSRFCSTLSANLSSAPLVSTDASDGYLSVRTCGYIMDPHADPSASPIYFVPNKKLAHEQITSDLSADAYANLAKSFTTLTPEPEEHVLRLKLAHNDELLDEQDPAQVALMAFVDKDDKPIVHAIDPPDLTRGVMCHVHGFSRSDARLLAQAYNVAFFVSSDCTTALPISQGVKNLLSANGHYYLADGGIVECDTAPRSSICNPNGSNRGVINKASENIQHFGGLGGLATIFKTLGGALAGSIPVVGPAFAGLLNSI